MAEERPFPLGMNYWPGESGIYWWEKFDASLVKRDFSLIAEYRLNPVRVFLPWEDFQPDMKRISVNALDTLVRVAEIAHDHRIQLLPTLFAGHVSGLNWLPAWMIESGPRKETSDIFSGGKIFRAKIRGLYSDREIWKYQKLLIHEITGALREHPAIWGWDLGSSLTGIPVFPPRDAVRRWFEEMVTELKRWHSHLPITTGIGQEHLTESRTPGLNDIVPFVEIVSVRAYPVYSGWADGPLDEKAPSFLCALARWLGGKDVLLEEFGVPMKPRTYTLSRADQEKLGLTPLVEEEEAATFFRKSLGLVKRQGIIGALVWCFSDYHSSLWDKPPLDERIPERFFGFFREDQTAKPAAEWGRGVPRVSEKVEWRSDWIDITKDEYWKKPSEQFSRLYKKFRERV